MATPAAVLHILVQAKGLERASREVRGLDRDLQRADKSSGAFTAIGKAAKVGMLAVAGGAALAGPKLISLASDAEETASKFKIVFAKETAGATKELDAFSKATGTSRFALKEQAAQFQALIRPMGLSTKNAANMSVGLTKLATDLASFNNTSVQDAMTALQSGLVGEAEPLRRFGVQLNAARLETFAYANGIAKQGAELTAAQKSQAAYGLIMKDTTLAQGDAVRTSGSFANQFKRLKSQVTDTATELAIKLLPAVTSGVQAITGFIGGMREGTGAGGVFVRVLKSVGGVVSSVVHAVRDIVGWFRQHEITTLALAAATGTIATALVALKVAALVPMIPVLYAQAAGWIAVRVAMLAANAPVILIVAGIAALVAGLVVAYQKSETFRNIVNAVGTAMTDAAVAVVGFVTDISSIPDKLLAAGNWIVATLIEGVKAMPAALLAAATWIKDRVIEGIKAYVTLYLDVGKWLVHRLVEGVKAIPGVLLAMAGWVKDRFIEGIKVYLEAYKALGGWVLRRLVDGIKALPDVVIGVGGWVKNRFGDGLRLVVDGITGLGNWVIHRVVEGIKATPDFVMGVGEWIKNRLMEGLKSIVDGVKGIGGWIIERIVDGLKGGANLLVDFLNDIIGVINKLPGVSIGKIEKFAEGGKYKAFARGGAYARTGGLVDKPMVMMGEEAPRHPEFVIPTNPAYRKRAQQLLAQAAGAVGFAQGGSFMSSAYGPPWTGINGTGVTATGVDLRPARQVLGVAVDPDVIGLGSMLKIRPNPFDTAEKFKAFDTGSAIQGNRIDFYDWRGRAEQLAWGMRNVLVDVVGGGGSLVGGVVESIGDVIGDLIGQLPSPDGLGWLKGLGKYVLDKVSGWIKDQAGGVVGGGAGIGGAVKGTMKMAQTIAKKFGLSISSGWRSVEHNAAVGGVEGSLHTHGTAANPGAIDLVGSVEAMNAASAWAAQNLNLVENLIHDVGSGLHLHLGFFRKGGILDGASFLGAYRDGGMLPADGLYYGHRGETVTPAGQARETVVEVNFANGMEWLRDFVNVQIVERDRHSSRTYRAGVAPA